jgi:hypothetical protein
LGQKKVFHHSKWRKYLFDKVLMFFVSGKIVNGHSLEKKRNKLKMRTDNKEKKKKKKKKKSRTLCSDGGAVLSFMQPATT